MMYIMGKKNNKKMDMTKVCKQKQKTKKNKKQKTEKRVSVHDIPRTSLV